MKHVATLLLLSLPLLETRAQLFNGSFEQAGAPSLEGWEWSCDQPGEENTAAPGAGQWCATKRPGHAKGCFPSYLFQRMPELQNGQLVTVSGWVRCQDETICLGGYIGLGRLSNGTVTYDDLAGSMDNAWTYVSITDTVEIDDGDTAVVVLTSGFIGGPIDPAPAYFDGISAEWVTGLNERSISAIVQRYDQGAQTLFLSAPAPVRSARLLDLTGRELRSNTDGLNTPSLALRTSALPTGVYFAVLNTTVGEHVVRFAVDQR